MKRLIAAPEVYTALETDVPHRTKWSWLIVLSLLGFILCVVTGVAPLQRWGGVSAMTQLPVSRLLFGVGAWLPAELPPLKGVRDSLATTGSGEFLLLVVFMFVLYGFCAWLLSRNVQFVNTRLLAVIMASIIIVALLFVFTPALLSHDVFAYADYGRTILVYHSNPYFVPPLLSSPHDPITQLNEWSSVGIAYGPLWLYTCMFAALVAGTDPLHYIFAFRVLGLCAHVLNTVLILAILRAAGRSPRIVGLGVLLYGLNPLVLVESCLNAHNDVLMSTFMLLGLWMVLRLTDEQCLAPTGYIPPIIAFTLAVLIKFTAAPLLLFFILFLFRKTLRGSQASGTGTSPQKRGLWFKALLHVCGAGLLCGGIALLLYAPFWLGHSVAAIIHSFSTAPSSYYGEHSLFRAFIEWAKLYGSPPNTSWKYRLLHVLSLRSTWDTINIAVLLTTLLLGFVLLWRVPTIQNVVFATLLVFEGVLLVTPWFYSWYVLWIVPLAALLFAGFDTPRNRAFTLFAFVFSASAFFTYIFPYYLGPFDGWLGTRYTLANGLPLFVLLLFLAARMFRKKRAIGPVVGV